MDRFITFFGDVGQTTAKYHHSVNRFLKSLGVGFILADNIESLVRVRTKGIPDGIGGGALLLSKSGIDSLMQSPVKLSEVNYDRVPVSESIFKNLQCRSAYPLGANANR